jgi:hypothetical protein
MERKGNKTKKNNKRDKTYTEQQERNRRFKNENMKKRKKENAGYFSEKMAK